MTGFSEFVSNNIWLCIVVGVILVIVVDEVLGLTRSIFGDNMDDAPATPQARARDQAERALDPLDAPPKEQEEGEVPIDALLTPKQPRRK